MYSNSPSPLESNLDPQVHILRFVYVRMHRSHLCLISNYLRLRDDRRACRDRASDCHYLVRLLTRLASVSGLRLLSEARSTALPIVSLACALTSTCEPQSTARRASSGRGREAAPASLAQRETSCEGQHRYRATYISSTALLSLLHPSSKDRQIDLSRCPVRIITLTLWFVRRRSMQVGEIGPRGYGQRKKGLTGRWKIGREYDGKLAET
jgi:hypothetical protein